MKEEQSRSKSLIHKLPLGIRSFLAGTIAGMGCAITAHPFDTVKVRM